jgi:hypothetical protein
MSKQQSTHRQDQQTVMPTVISVAHPQDRVHLTLYETDPITGNTDLLPVCSMSTIEAILSTAPGQSYLIF